MPEFSRILLSRLKFIGDVVLTTPVIRAVRQKYPEAFIAYLGEKNAASLLEHNPCLDEVIPFDLAKPALFEQPRVMRLLRQKKFDAFVDFFSNPRTALLAAASGARVRIGKDVKGRGRLYTDRIKDDGKPKTAVQFHYQYVKPLGVEPTAWRTEVFLTEDEKREARNYLSWQGIDVSRTIVGVHPGASWPAKMWPAENFGALIDRLRAKLNAQVVLTQGPGDAEVVKKVLHASVGNSLAIPPLPLRQLAAIVSLFSLYIANDNGTMHISAALGVRTIGIFGPGEEAIWFPYVPPFYDAASGHAALRMDVPCHPCHLDFCNRSGAGYMECMKLLTVDEVLRRAEKTLKG